MQITCWFHPVVDNVLGEDGTRTFLSAVSYDGLKLKLFNNEVSSSAVEIVQIFQIYENKTRNTKNLKNCQKINSGYFYRFEIEKERRLHSIRLRTAADDWNSFENAALTIKGRKNDQSQWEHLDVTRTNLVPYPSFAFTDYSKNYYFKHFILTSNNWSFKICEIVLFAYLDECGHPEVPLHGHVHFEPGDTKATYRCDDGYHLASNISNRHCIQGRWNGSQPICSNTSLKMKYFIHFKNKKTV